MGCSSSTPQTCKRNGRGTEAFPKHLPRLQSRDKNRSVGLSQNLAWIQEKNFEERFEVVKVIGQGSIGEVSVVRRKSPNNSFRGRAAVKDTSSEFGDGEISGGSTSGGSISGGSASGTQQHRLYAMKSIHVNRLSKGMVEEFENEVDILQRLHHPNIIQLREVFYFKKKIYMCMTLCTGGQLNHRDFNEEQVCSVMSQTIRALVYMHETAKICHRDLKMENIMLESAEEPLVVKLIDFGLSKVFTEGDKMRTACGTVYTMAPEVLTGAGYTQKADLWSAGVIAFVLLCGNLPFLRDETDLNDKDKVEKLAQARFMFNDPAWKRISSGGKAFVRGLLKKLPGFRWTAREALDHCADVWGPSILRNDSVDLSKHSETGSQTNSTSAQLSPCRLSESGSPMTPISPETPTHASRRRQRAVPGAIATSMRRFADYGEFKKAALMVTAFQLGKEEIKQLKDAFLEADTEGNGAISLEELRTLLREHGVDGAEVGRVFGAVDMDNSGRLHYMEFLAATVEARGYIEEENLKEAFERLDVDGTGFITRDNLRAVLGKTYDNTLIDKMLEEGDGSASGSIDWHDFLEMMKPVMAQEYRKEAEAMLSDTSAALKEAIEVEKRAVDQTPSFAGTSRQSSGAKESGSSNR